MLVSIYTDGAARGNPDGPGGYGTILEYVDSKGELHTKELSKGYEKTTNNRMELMAVIAGLEALNRPCDVKLYSDSKYVVDAFNQNWIGGWLKKGWKRVALIAAVGGLVLFCNQSSLKQIATISIPKNVYKVEDYLLTVAELIHRDSTKEEPKVALPLEYNLQARQYDPSLRLTIERNKMMFWLGIDTAGSYTDENQSYRYQSDIMDVIYGGRNTETSVLKKALAKTRTDYLVAYKKNDVHETIREAGCQAVGETPEAVVYLTSYGKKHKE